MMMTETTQQARQQLQQIHRIDTQLKHKESQLQELELQLTQAGGIQYDRERVQASPMPDRLSNDIIRLVELKEQVIKERVEYLQKKERVVNEIHSLEDPREMDILVKRYIEGKTWDRIADEMNYSIRRVHQLHRQALENIETLHTIAHKNVI